MSESRGLDADWKHVDPYRPVGKNEIEIATVQAAFTREITAEVEGIIPGLKTNEVVFAERRNETLVVWQCSQYFWRRAWDVKEKADAILVPALAQGLGERHQMIIMHPDEVIRPEDLVQLARKVIIDAQIAAQVPA